MITPLSLWGLHAGYDPSAESFTPDEPITALSDQSGRGLTVTAAGSARPVYRAHRLNGYGIIEFDGIDDVLTAASAPDWTALHDGHGLTVIAVVRQHTANPNRLDSVIDTCGGSSGNVGVYLGLDDRASVPRQNTTVGFVSRGVGGAFRVEAVTKECLRPASWQIVVWRVGTAMLSEADVVTRIDGLTVGTATLQYPPVSTAPAFPLRVGRLGTSSLYSAIDLAGLWIYDRALDDADVVALETWAAGRFGLSRCEVVSDRPGYEGFPALVPSGDDDICAYYSAASHGPTARTAVLLQRRTLSGWKRPTVIAEHPTLDTRGVSLTRLPSGTLLASGFYHGGGTAITAQVWRSTDDGASWSPSSVSTDFTLLSASDGSAVVMPTGTVLLPIYGKDTGDAVYSPALLSSDDDGVTFALYARIADGPATNEDLSETAVFYDGPVLMAVTRNDTAKRFTVRRSHDHGLTWGPPTAIGLNIGGRPAVIALASGRHLLVCRSRLGNMRGIIHWTDDAFVTLSAAAYAVDGINGFHTYSSGYEVEPGAIRLVTASELSVFSVAPVRSLVRVCTVYESSVVGA